MSGDLIKDLINLRGRRTRIGLLASLATAAALASAAAFPAAAPAAAVPRFTWSGAHFVEKAPFGQPSNVVAVSCPSRTQCLAIDQWGYLLSSTDPAGGARTWHIGRSAVPSISGTPAMSCVRRPAPHSRLLCVAIDHREPWASTDPAGGRTAWHPAAVSVRLASIDCPSVSFCIGGGQGGLAWSTDPTGGKAAWHSLTIGGGEGSYQPSCPTASFCVAGDSNYGDVLTSTDPAGGKAKWKDADITGSTPVGFLSCPKASLCVASHGGTVLTSTRPAGGASAWKQTPLPASALGIVCPSTTECIGQSFGDSPDVVTSTDPTGGASAWHLAAGVVLSGGTQLSCPVSGLCVSVVKDSIVTSTDPTGGSAGWGHPVAVDGRTLIQSLACPTVTLCVAGDAQGNVLSSTKPAGGSWRLAHVGEFQFAISAISCPDASFCVAVQDGDVITSTDPAGSASAWHTTLADPSAAIASMDCPTSTLCVGFDGRGSVVTSTNPMGGPSAWHVASVDLGDTISGVSCPSARLCVASSGDGKILMSTNPAGGASAWQVFTLVPGGDAINAPSCPTTSLCIVTFEREVLYTKDPAAGLTHWFKVQPKDQPPGNLDCLSAKLCVGITSNTSIAVSADPLSSGDAWPATTINPAPGGLQVRVLGCASRALCVTGDDRGDVYTGAESGG